MNKEIKFRAWDKKLAKMVSFSNCKDGILFSQGVMEVSSGWDGDGCPTFDDTDLERYIVEQYTGLKDKNGKDEAYFGDRVQLYDKDGKIDGHTGILVWHDKIHGIGVETKRGLHPLYLYTSLEVIGHIHEDK